MHDEKIWGLDISNDKYLLTGGGDSSLKLWQDNSLEQEQKQKEDQLQKIMDEQKLSGLIRQEDYVNAALMAFRLNKLRDFYLVIQRIITNAQQKVDPVDAVLQDRLRFRNFTSNVANVSDSQKAV